MNIIAENLRDTSLNPQGKVTPIAKNIHIRTEFSGVCAAESALESCVGAYAKVCNDRIHVKVQSCADWNTASRTVIANNTDACVFKDISDVLPQQVRDDMKGLVYTEASQKH